MAQWVQISPAYFDSTFLVMIYRRDIEDKRRYLVELSLQRIAYMCDISPRYHRYIARTKSDIQRLSFALLLHNTVLSIRTLKSSSCILSKQIMPLPLYTLLSCCFPTYPLHPCQSCNNLPLNTVRIVAVLTV